ncbi:putative Sperm-associated antigen 6 [Monoraphidium neglectum]|uniref:Putative Sperm-associated antigen 6 n=1 Tax=Monoraphidium neglectum TaxID=145388 RepID=A0A0D2KCQ8_9CHLO|nr:putative Sperm-associated antigen 6 [Monoraphidium neglectum]KIZ07868.1 putative Sperm-associated antigen 6 [Monoraphidium neglectum]|eukprot:XP_013906887.1 putative Sperm-associated antigen 6 [Monoraphidium neglectum]
MATRAVLQTFERYQKERVAFVSAVAEMAKNPQNIEALQQAGAMALLRPLLLDNVPSIQQSAAMALGRLANYSDDLAEAVVQNEILPQLVYSLSEQNRFYKKAAGYCLRAVAKHSPELAQAVVDSGALDSLVTCLEEFDPGVKESACWCLGYMAGHSTELAQQVVDAGAVPLLVLCVQEPELALKRVAASALSDIAKHTPELAQSVVDAGAVAYLAPLVVNQDAKLKRQVCSALAQVAKHSVDLAEVVVEAEVFPKLLTCLKFPDEFVRKHAATLVREVAKHTPELAQLVVANGGVAALVEYITDSVGNNALPGIMALGYIAAFSETLALAVIAEKALPPLVAALAQEPEDHVKAATAWALGQLGRHTPDHAKAVADTGVLATLVALEASSSSSEDLATKARRSLKSIVSKLSHLPALDSLVHSPLPEGVMRLVLEQAGKVLSNDAAGRSQFVHSGGLAAVQQLAEAPGSKLKEAVEIINSAYPEEIVRYYSPSYSKQLLDKLDAAANA